MHTTTVRFAPSDWKALAEVCERDGVPKAQYIREATVALLAVARERERLAHLERERAELSRRVARLERALRLQLATTGAGGDDGRF
jgi:hypothetical protein